MKRLLLGLVASTLLFAFGAVNATPAPLVLTPAGGEMVTATEAAADAWNEWEGHVVFTVGPDGIPLTWADTIIWNGTPVAAGWFPDSRRIEVTTAYLPERDCLRCTIAHELGHVLGIPHGDDGPFGLETGPPECNVRGNC